MRGEGHVVFRHMVLLALLLGRPRQGCQRRPPFCIPLCEVVQREGSEVLWVDKGSKMELTGAQEMLSLFPCLEGTTDRSLRLGPKTQPHTPGNGKEQRE